MAFSVRIKEKQKGNQDEKIQFPRLFLAQKQFSLRKMVISFTYNVNAIQRETKYDEPNNCKNPRNNFLHWRSSAN